MSSAARFYRAVLSSSLGTGLSRIAGLLRTQALAAFLGAGAASDAFNIAWTIPNAFRRFVADEGLTGALIPAIARAEEVSVEDARRLANTTLSFLVAVCSLIVALLALGSESAVLAFAWAFQDEPGQVALAVSLLRLTAPVVFMVSMTSFMEGLLNHRDHYFVPKMAPGILALGIAAGVAMHEPLGLSAAHGAAWGALVGAVAHTLVNVPVLVRHWGPVRPGFAFGDPRFRQMARELSKVVAIGLLAQVNILALRQFTTSAGVGVTTHYDMATRLVDLAQGVIAVGIGSALLPALSKAAAAKDEVALGRELSRSLRLASFLLFPAAATLAGFGLPVAAMLLRFRSYSLADVEQTALAMAVMTPFMLAVAGINLLKKVFFAYDWRTALLAVAAVGVATTVALGLWLTPRLGLLGATAALSGSTVVQLAIYAILLRRWLGDGVGMRNLPAALLRMAGCSVAPTVWFLLVAPWGTWADGPFSWGNWGVFTVGMAGGAALYLGASYLAGVEELTRLVALLRRRLGA